MSAVCRKALVCSLNLSSVQVNEITACIGKHACVEKITLSRIIWYIRGLMKIKLISRPTHTEIRNYTRYDLQCAIGNRVTE